MALRRLKAKRVLDLMNCTPENEENSAPDASRRAFLAAAATALAAVGIVGCSAPASNAPTSGGLSVVPADSAAGDIRNAPVATAEVQKITDKLYSVSGGANLKINEALGFVIETSADKSDPGVLFRDESGTLRAMSARCTHVGCIVAWRSDTQKLHCPCHASQFDISGKVLGGPAKKSLPRWKVETKGNDALVSI
jgi:Rieske Fe-S protein